jgi:hypothetical protein
MTNHGTQIPRDYRSILFLLTLQRPLKTLNSSQRPAKTTAHRKEKSTARSEERGAAMVAAIVAMALLLISGYILASRSFWFFNSALKTSDFKTAQDVAEFGASELINQLNKDENGYLLVLHAPCWQESNIDTEGLFKATPRPNKITGVANNTTTSTQWRVIPITRGQSIKTAETSGTYARYQLSDYRAPRRMNASADLSFKDSTCPTDPYANRLGGSAFLTIKAELYRNNRLSGQHIITQEVHVKGASASSTGETSMVLTNGGELNTSKPWMDYDNDNTKDTNEPWIDIFCVYCTGTTQAELKSERIPVGVGFQGTMLNEYNGTIITGAFAFPKFRFEDYNDNKIKDGAEPNVHADLLAALTAKGLNTSSPPDLSSASSTYPYKSSSFSDDNLVQECAVVTDSTTNPSRPSQYIGCLVNKVDLCSSAKSCPSGNKTIIVNTDKTNGRPVYIFVQAVGADAVSIDGQESLVNTQPDSPLTLGLFGLPPTTAYPNPEPSCTDQGIKVTGTESLSGIWTWFPRGSLDFGAGNPKLKGLLWVCDFDGRGNLKFMGSNEDIANIGCGENKPCGLFKYRAQGIARINREE